MFIFGRSRIAVAIVNTAYDFLFHRSYTYRLCLPFSKYCELLVEGGKFFLPHLYLAPSLGMTPVEPHIKIFVVSKTQSYCAVLFEWRYV